MAHAQPSWFPQTDKDATTLHIIPEQGRSYHHILLLCPSNVIPAKVYWEPRVGV